MLVYLWAVAIVSLLVGLVLTIGSQSNEVIAETGRTESEILTMGIVELVIGVLVVLVALALASGSSGARMLVAGVMLVRIVATVVIVAANHTTGYFLAGFLHVLLPVFIIWAMYGNDKADAFFEQLQ